MPNHEKKRLLCESIFVPIDRWTLVLKKNGKRSFSYESKTLMSFIPMSKTSLLHPIIKKGRLLCESVIVLFDRWTLILKRWWEEKILNETKVSMSFIPMRRMNLWCSIMEKKAITIWICVCSNWQMNFKSKKWWKEKLFLWNQSTNVIYPNE